MSFILNYARAAWTELFGPLAHGAPPYKTRLRSHSHTLSPPRWLLLTPTKSHWAPSLKARNPTDVSSRKCPHCKKSFNVNLKTHRISKPTPRKRKGSKPMRFVTFWRGYREVGEDEVEGKEDRSPTMKTRSGRRVNHY